MLIGRAEPGNRAFGRVLLAGGVLGLFWYGHNHPWSVALFEPLSLITARVTQALLHWGGLEVLRVGVILAHSGGFSIRIDPACTAVLPAGLLVAALWVAQCRGGAMIVGALLMTLLNQLRLVTLMWVGVHSPARFDLVHEWVWPLALSCIGILFLLSARPKAPLEVRS